MKEAIEPLGVTVSRPDTHVYVVLSVFCLADCYNGLLRNKAVSNGAVSYYIDGAVTTRMSRSTYGMSASTTYDSTNPEHVKRGRHITIHAVTGEPRLPCNFTVILPIVRVTPLTNS